MAKIIVHGYKEANLINLAVEVYKNNEFALIGYVKRNDIIIVDAEEGDILLFKYRQHKAALSVSNGTTEIFLQMNRWTGGISAYQNGNETVASASERVMTSNQPAEKTGKRSNRKWRNIAVFFLAFLGVFIAFGLYHDYKENERRKKMQMFYKEKEQGPTVILMPGMPGGDTYSGAETNQSGNTKVCWNCHGTKVVPAGYSIVGDEYGSTNCTAEIFGPSDHICDIRMCSLCGQSHCVSMGSHKTCPVCDGHGVIP